MSSSPAVSSRTIDLDGFRASFGGPIICPEDPAYDAARRVFNRMFDTRPAVIAQCTGVADVIAALKFGRSFDLPIAIRGGGHAVDGKGSCSGGIVIDLRLMNSVLVDPLQRRAVAQGGARLATLDRETQLYGLAVPTGTVSDTGIGGLTLGGGIGWLMRKYGLTIDSVVQFEVVTVEGEIVRANAAAHPDLYWGLRGGGGNFGIVTSFEYELHPVGPTVIGGGMLFTRDKMRDLMRIWADMMTMAPRDLQLGISFGPVPRVPAMPEDLHGQMMGQIGICFLGESGALSEMLKPLRELGPERDFVRPMSFVDVQRMGDDGLYHPLQPGGMRLYEKGGYTARFPDPVIDTIVDWMDRLPEPSGGHPGDGGLFLAWAMGGAIQDVADGATAFSRADTGYMWEAAAFWDDEGEDDRYMGWARGLAATMRPFSADHYYMNIHSEEDEGRHRASWAPEKYERLLALKRALDPENVLRINKNIRP